jgi:hypothetical protein
MAIPLFLIAAQAALMPILCLFAHKNIPQMQQAAALRDRRGVEGHF